MNNDRQTVLEFSIIAGLVIVAALAILGNAGKKAFLPPEGSATQPTTQNTVEQR